jgi:hypothetical protein
LVFDKLVKMESMKRVSRLPKLRFL